MQTPELLTQIKSVITQHHPDIHAPMTDEVRWQILQNLLTFTPQIPHPASGDTLLRWQILAYLAGIDLTLVKWFEAHLDTISILAEIGVADVPKGFGAIWAAEGHPNPVRFDNGFVNGVKTWCSGANLVDFALMTYRDEQNQSQLVLIDLKTHKNTLQIDNSTWQAVGMQATDTATLTFHDTPATLVGTPNQYLNRAGFWHGAGGVAACWYGATVAIADYLRQGYQRKPHAFKAMYLGQVSTALAVTQQYFYQVAKLIDNEPNNAHELAIRQLRQQVETTARLVMEQVGIALGATPFCQNAHFARLNADLSVFIRQSHGAFDWQKIGELVVEQPDNKWCL